MKKILKSIAVLAVSALAMVSCQKELLGPAVQEGQEVAVSIDLTTPLMGTKAYADGTTVDVVRVHVYQHDANGGLVYIQPNATTATPSKDVTMLGGTASYSTRLVTGQTYTFVFWAEKKDNGAYTYDPASKTISVDYSNAAGNDENRDAFYAVLEDTITGAYSATVELHRPFAQLNFGVTDEDYAAAVAAGITVNGAAVKLTNVAKTLNLLDGSVSGTETVTFANASLPSETLSAANDTYKYVAMDYVLVGKDAKTLSDVTLALDVQGTTSTDPEYTYSNVPLQGNYRTNIVGSLFTSPADIQIEVVPGFNNPDENVVVENVSNIIAANTAFASGATSVNVTEITSSDPDAIILPATTSEVSLTLPAAPADKNITIKYADDATVYPAALNITAVNAESLTIVAPKTHVEVNGVTVTSLTASTSNTTLVVGADVTVGTLTVKSGSAVIYGTVTNLVKEEGAGKIEWHVSNSSNMTEALNDADTIVLENDIQPSNFESWFKIQRDVTIDLNSFSLSAYWYPLQITKGKVNIIGSGELIGKYSMLLKGSTDDVADYCVVNLGPDVELKSSICGIIVNPPASTGYNNYGIVVNSEAKIISDAESSIGITINGSNKQTGVNVPKFNIKGGTIKATYGIYAAGYAEWSLNNCEVEGDETAIEIRAGKMTINGGDYKATHTPFSITPDGNGPTISGAALGISQHTTDLPIDVVVNGGTFTGEYSIYEKDVQNESARDQIKLTVNNGTFNGAIYSQNNPNAIIKGTYSDPSALNYLADNADVKIDVQQDVTSGFFTLPADAKAEIALNGNKVTFTAASSKGHGSKIYGDLVINGSGYIGDPTQNTVGYLFDMYGDSTLLVEGDATIESGLTCIQLSDNAHATVKGGKWIGDEWQSKYWTINKIDSSKDSAVVEVMGGEFYKFDPSNSATENPVQNWVPEGYTVTLENDWYKVTAQ